MRPFALLLAELNNHVFRWKYDPPLPRLTVDEILGTKRRRPAKPVIKLKPSQLRGMFTRN